ncbi:protein kinase [Streptomyces sp. NBC_00335]|uniref:serine/threonine-protein kinase n=1 Tax=unclassified Streptomyces TaxID=2593676 RepID=UPI002257531F|nr:MULTISPECIES: serine/threonine protein kinase [unclassified Streptomyces]MCX5404954.1 protein kinase [Streptomyces sp. NBC_00086]
MSSAPSAGIFQPLKADDPEIVGGYRLAAVLGAGGMGKVYLSYTPGGRPIAIKVIRSEFGEDPEFRRRFQQEVRSAERVQGLYTAPVIDSDTEGAQPWLATAYVPGPSLAHAVALHGALPTRSVLLLAVGVAEALTVIHGAGIVHRDLKPANVLLASDGPRVIDFGIARAADTTALTSTGVSVGTPAFMAPEQASAGTITPATDVFALGQMAAFAAIGSSVYGDGPSHAVLYRIVHEDPDLSGLPEELRPLVTRCLSRDPAERPDLTEVIALCHAAAAAPLRQGEDWLPRAIVGAITERVHLLPAPAHTPAPVQASAPQPPTAAPAQPPAPVQAPTQAPTPAPIPIPIPTERSPQPSAQSGQGTVPTGYGTPQPYGQPGYAQPPQQQPSYAQPPRQQPAYAQPTYAQPQPQPGYAQPGWGQQTYPPAPKRPKRTGLIVTLSVVGAVIGLAVLGSLLPDGSKKNGAAGSPGGGSGGGSGASASASPGTSASPGKAADKPVDPKPVSYQDIDVPEDHQLLLADNPPRPAEPTSGSVTYGHGDIYYYRGALSEDKFGTDNGKMVLLNNAEKGSLETCRSVTRFTEEIDFNQLTNGSQVCLLSDAGHIAVVTFRGKSAAKEPSRYMTVDLTIWRNAEEAKRD